MTKLVSVEIYDPKISQLITIMHKPLTIPADCTDIFKIFRDVTKVAYHSI